jgi:chromate transporter
VLLLAFTAFGGPQAHIAMFLDLLVKKRGYLTESDLIELNALCQILPGPTSTQTITAIGYRIGGANLAYLTLLIWIMPAVTIMTIAAITISNLQEQNISIEFTRIIQPMAVGFVAFAAVRISTKVIKSKTGIVLMLLSLAASLAYPSPYLFPVLLIVAGLLSSIKYKTQDIEEKEKIKIEWANFILWGSVFLMAAILGGYTHYLPLRLFENFYRNGSLIFGGGQVLIPFLYTEFVEFKGYLSSEEFLSGYALMQSLPGPVFSFCAYVGSLSMRSFGVWGEILGAAAGAIGIFLPGIFLIFFVIRFWDGLKKYRRVKASLEGINAASSGMVISAAILMFMPLEPNYLNFGVTICTFLLLMFTKIPAPILIIVGLVVGILI